MSSKFSLHDVNQKRYATGIVRPKTTALFFDKLWAPVEIRESEYGEIFGLCDMPREVRMTKKDYTDYEKYERFQWSLIQALYYGTVTDIDSAYSRTLELLTSTGRNFELMKCAEIFARELGMNMTPIFVDETEYEKQAKAYNERVKKSIERYNEGIKRFEMKYQTQNIPAANKGISVTINALPMIVEETLEWDQVLEMRSDKQEIEKLKRFIRWMNQDFKGKNSSEIHEQLYKAYDDYTYALNKYGIKTVLSGITTIVAAATSIEMSMDNIKSASAALGLVVSAGLITYLSDTMMKYRDLKREPIAYVYDILSTAENTWWEEKEY